MAVSSRLKKGSFSTVPDKSWLSLKWHPNKTIMKPDELEKELTYPPEQVDKEILDRVQGSIIGMALGDAVGAHVEFRPQAYMAKNPVTDLRGGGTWGLKKGQFTDDTSMALCLANSLVVCQDFIPYDQLVRYKWWYRHGYMSSTGQCFDIGAATKTSLDEFESRQVRFGQKYNILPKDMDSLSDPQILSQFNVDCSQKGVAGNGALMRLAPVPLFFYNHPVHAIEFSGVSGRITHGDQSAYDACRYYGALIVAALKGEKKNKLLADGFYSDHKEWFNDKPLHQDILKIAQGSFKKPEGYKAGIRGRGYIVNALEAALWAFCYDNNSFEEGVLKAVNLGDDTDTTAAIYGQLAGAYYGYKNLPPKWLEFIYAQNFIQCLSAWIVCEGKLWQPNKTHASIMNNSTRQQPPGATQQSNFNTKTSSQKQQGSGSMLQGATKTNGRTENNGNLQSTHTNQRSDWEFDRNAAQNEKPGYSHEKVKTYNDVGVWLESLGKEYAVYRRNFEENIVDGFWLLNYVNDEILKQYGVEEKDHRHKILNHIEDLKKQIST